MVKPGLNYSQPSEQNIICGSAGCPYDSLAGQIYQAASQANGLVVMCLLFHNLMMSFWLFSQFFYRFASFFYWYLYLKLVLCDFYSTYIAHPASAWMDDYFSWLEPVDSGIPCCRYALEPNGSKIFCSSSGECFFCYLTLCTCPFDQVSDYFFLIVIV